MLLSEIKHTPELATGVCGVTRLPVVIEKSISYIYMKVEKEFNGKKEIHYEAVTWKDKISFGQIESLLLDLPLTEIDKMDLDKIMIRFGWISNDMYQLEWVSISDLFRSYLVGDLTPTEKNKFQIICRTLCIPMRKMTAVRKEYKARQMAKLEEIPRKEEDFI